MRDEKFKIERAIEAPTGRVPPGRTWALTLSLSRTREGTSGLFRYRSAPHAAQMR